MTTFKSFIDNNLNNGLISARYWIEAGIRSPELSRNPNPREALIPGGRVRECRETGRFFRFPAGVSVQYHLGEIMKHLTAFTLALLAVAFAQAEDTRFGFQATVSKPSGDVGDTDWMDSKLGYGVGLHLLVDLGGGGAIVPRIDYTMYKNDQTIGTFITQDARLKILSGGADFHYYFSGEASQGFYVLGGLGYRWLIPGCFHMHPSIGRFGQVAHAVGKPPQGVP